MRTEQNFLIRYGLQHFVEFSPTHGDRVFRIDGTGNSKLADHAKRLIEGNYTDAATVVER